MGLPHPHATDPTWVGQADRDSMGLLTVFANFRIDSDERFLRMQDSFRSFRNADIEKWVINVRGPLKREAADFLRAELGSQLRLYELESTRGWFADSAKMLGSIDSPYVFYWVEDHLLVGGVDYLNQVVAEMRALDADYLLYSAFHAGDGLASLACLPTLDGNGIVVVDYDRRNHSQRMMLVREKGLTCSTFIISTVGIFRRSLFERILLTNDPLLKRWPKGFPFDFEKTQNDIHWLPLRVGHTKRELFAFIDDDHGRVGHSLISRGLYPNRETRESMLAIREKPADRLAALLAYRGLLSRSREAINRWYGRGVRPLAARLGLVIGRRT